MDNVVLRCRAICTGLYFFLTGAEYAIIIPTLNGYLNYLGAERYFLGLVLSAFSLTGLISAPIYGRISDRTRTSKICIIVGNVLEIGGNFMYFASTSGHMTLFSRLIAGLGAGAASSIYGMISWTTTEDERTKAFSKCMLFRQIGIVVGPAFNIVLNSIDSTIGPFKINSFNSPGLLMASVWTLHTLLIIFLYKDPKLDLVTAEAVNHTVQTGEYEHINPTPECSSHTTIRVRSFKDEFLRDEVIVCLTANFLGIFCQCSMETALAPITKLFFDWGGLQNSILFGVGGAVVALGYVSLGFISKRVPDRGLLLYGVIGMVIVYVMYTSTFLILWIHQNEINASWVLPMFIVLTAVLTISLPYAWASQASLFSKITSKETQSFNQGIRIASLGIGQILGPIWASSLATIDGLPIMAGVSLFLNVLLLGMILCSYKRLRTPCEIATGSNSVPSVSGTARKHEENFDESSPLLS